jgi:hypothetical protein
MADNDQFRILVGGTATNAGYAEIATADDGTEPIYVRQYTGVFSTLARTATLLDGSGNTSFPGTVSAAFSGNLTGTASFATFATNAMSASIAANAVTASRALNANTASFATSAASATSASYATFAATATSATSATSAGSATSASYATFAATATSAATATNLSNTGTVTLASAIESNAITITQPSYTTDTPVKLLNFAWYSDVWSLGNIRSGASPSNGFGIYLNSTESVRINMSGNVGIGTTSPSARLHVSGADAIIRNAYIGEVATYGAENTQFSHISRAGAGEYSFLSSYDGVTYINAKTGANIRFRVNNADKILMDSSGNLGIGTTSPIAPLHVVGSVRAVLTSLAGGDTLISAINGVSNGYRILVDTSNNITYTWNTGANATALTITSGGNVGINTTSPSQKLQINEVLRTEYYGTDNGTPADAMNIMGTGAFRGLGTGSALVFTVPANTDGSNMWAQARILGTGDNGSNGDANGAMFLQTRSLYNPGIGGSWNWRTNMVLRASGNVGIGTISPAYTLDVNGPSRFQGFGVNSTPISTGTSANFVRFTNTGGDFYLGQESSTAGGFFTGALSYASVLYSGTSQQFIIGGTSRMLINTSGNVGIGTTSPGAQLEVTSTTGGTLRLKRDDTSVTDNETIGTVEFYTNDGDGPHVTSYIRGLGADLSGQNYGRFGAMSFGVSKTANTDAVEAVRIDLSGNVGIGTTSPGAKLEVNGATNIFGQTTITSDSTEQLTIKTLTDTNRNLIIGYNYSGNYGSIQAVQQAVAYRNLILNQSGGNVGIGTTSPPNLLSVRGNLDLGATGYAYAGPSQYGGLMFPRGQILYSNSNTQNQFYLSSNAYTNASGVFAYRNSSQPALAIGLDDGGMAFLTAGNGTADATISFTAAMSINNGGNVGIGTTSPSAPLHVSSSTTGNVFRVHTRANTAIFVSGSGIVGIGTSNPFDSSQFTLDVDGGFVVKNTTGKTAQFLFINADPASGGNNGFIKQTVGGTSTSAYSAIQVYYGASVAAGTLQLQPSGGNVGIGTTSAPNKLEVSGVVSCTGFAANDGEIHLRPYTDPTHKLYYASGDIDVWEYNTKLEFRQYNGGGTRIVTMGITSGGTMTVAADLVAYGSPSDISLKTNIKPLEGALEKVMKLQGVSFTWKEDTDTNKIVGIKDDIGFIAQEVQEVVPDLVRKNDNGLLSLRDKGITALLVEAIKEQQIQIDELKYLLKNK